MNLEKEELLLLLLISTIILGVPIFFFFPFCSYGPFLLFIPTWDLLTSPLFAPSPVSTAGIGNSSPLFFSSAHSSSHPISSSLIITCNYLFLFFFFFFLAFFLSHIHGAQIAPRTLPHQDLPARRRSFHRRRRFLESIGLYLHRMENRRFRQRFATQLLQTQQFL